MMIWQHLLRLREEGATGKGGGVGRARGHRAEVGAALLSCSLSVKSD